MSMLGIHLELQEILTKKKEGFDNCKSHLILFLSFIRTSTGQMEKNLTFYNKIVFTVRTIYMNNTEKKTKKKWYDTWWGLLWTLAIVDANPGRGIQTFMEVDRELKDLSEVAEDVRDKKLSPCIDPAMGESCENIA
jgi:hypothetical protein